MHEGVVLVLSWWWCSGWSVEDGGGGLLSACYVLIFPFKSNEILLSVSCNQLHKGVKEVSTG